MKLKRKFNTILDIQKVFDQGRTSQRKNSAFSGIFSTL